MFNFFSRRDVQPPVRPELVYMALNNGIVASDDYLAKSYNSLPDIVTELPEQSFHSSDALPLDRLNDILSSNYNGMEHGFVRMNDWTWYLVGKTNLRGCTGEMFEWWFSHCDNVERFKWCHPIHNIDGGEFDPTFYAVQPEDRLPGHYINHRYSGKRIIAGEKHRFHIDYTNPIDYLDTSKFHQAGITACVTGQLYVTDKDLGDIFLGHIVHVVKEKSVGVNELITRMWLGHIDKQDVGFLPPSVVKYLANSLFYRYFYLTSSWARAYWTHMIQEMGCIANLIPPIRESDLKYFQFRKEFFPNGLVIDEAKNHLRNLEIENSLFRGDGNERERAGREFKESELPRPGPGNLVINTPELEPWVDLSYSGGRNTLPEEEKEGQRRERGVGLGNRNTSLRARQLYTPAAQPGIQSSPSMKSMDTPLSLSQRINFADDSDEDLDQNTEIRPSQGTGRQFDQDPEKMTYSTNDLGGGVDI